MVLPRFRLRAPPRRRAPLDRDELTPHRRHRRRRRRRYCFCCCCCCFCCCCYHSVVGLKSRISCHYGVALDKQGGTSTSLQIISSERRASAATIGRGVCCSGGPPTARWENPTPLILVILRLHLSSICICSGCRIVPV